MIWILTITVIVTGLVGNGSTGDSSNAQTKAVSLLRANLANYDKEVRPTGVNDTGPAIVSITMFIRHIEEIDYNKQDWKIQATVRMQWIDARLSYKPSNDFRFILVSTPETIKEVWKPDVFFSNEKTFVYHEGLNRNQYMRIFSNGEILHSIRTTLRLSCPMNLYTFPFDSHTCSIRIATYGSSSEEVILTWKKADPLLVTSELHLSHFLLHQFAVKDCDSGGVYSYCQAKFLFQRVLSPFWNQGCFPMIVAVFLGWMTFWLKPNSISRISVVLASFFYFKQTDLQFRQKYSPDVSYETLYDKFTHTSFCFILCAVIQFIVVSYLTSLYEDETTAPKRDSKLGRSEFQGPVSSSNERPGAIDEVEKDSMKTCHGCLEAYKKRRSSWVLDAIVRITYPIAFIIYLIILYVQLAPAGLHETE